MKSKLEQEEIRKKIYRMILPITADNVLQMLAGLVSMAMVGRINTLSIDAVGISSRVTQLMWALFKGVATGASVFVAQSYGAGKFEKLRAVTWQTLISSTAIIIVLQQIIFWNASAILSIFNPSRELMKSGVTYLRIVSWGLPFMVIMIVVAGVLQGMGNAKTPMKISIIMNVVNILLGYILIFGNLGFNPMWIKGAGYAMVIAQFTGAAMGLYVLFSKNGVLGSIGKGKLPKVDLHQVYEVYRVGIPSSMESVFWQMAAIILTTIILSFGETAYAAYQIGLQLESISYTPAMGFGVAATTFIGQCLGERNGKGRIYLKELIKGSLLVTAVGASILLFLPGTIMKLMTNDISVVKLGSIYLILMGLVQVPQNLSGVLNGAMRGAGFTRVPMIVAGIGIWGIRIPVSFLLTRYYSFGIVSIWIVFCIDLMIRFILSFSLYKTKNIYKAKLVFEDERVDAVN